MLDGGYLASYLNMLVGIPHCYPTLENLVMDVLVEQVMPSLHLTLWLLRGVCCADKGSLPQSVRYWWGSLSVYDKKYQQC